MTGVSVRSHGNRIWALARRMNAMLCCVGRPNAMACKAVPKGCLVHPGAPRMGKAKRVSWDPAIFVRTEHDNGRSEGDAGVVRSQVSVRLNGFGKPESDPEVSATGAINALPASAGTDVSASPVFTWGGGSTV
ncbi:hypothetical protein [Candidatus Anaplasma sp. TIGMIC]|uniref:hypothetical protein n=1 Tax=Candidatus Anaplasma sp. TIGMIC TaxID=3020713 RepID=UPI00232B5A07|nr:hypothetical protein [Candidatus Anaplasma sp. TIGMIC]MDB1135406.1 hypothetical protein [Candidatus Anaplasma sp. TIGMIC]